MSSQTSVRSKRCIYTPSEFARDSLLYLQECGISQSLQLHTSRRSGLSSYLVFTVLSGSGDFDYDHETYTLNQGDIVFIDCRKPYSHSTSTNFWTLQWCHFNSRDMENIYEKYRQRDGKPVIKGLDSSRLVHLLNDLQIVAESEDYIRDMKIFEILASVLTFLMESTTYENLFAFSRSTKDFSAIFEYLKEHYGKKITLDSLAEEFYINKFYLSKKFKEIYGVTIMNYLDSLRISKAKELLRYSDKTVGEIAEEIGITDSNYFSRVFKKSEGMTPSQYRSLW